VWQGEIGDARALLRTLGDGLTPDQRDYLEMRWKRLLWWFAGERPDEPADTDGGSSGVAQSSPSTPANDAQRVSMLAIGGQAPQVLADAFALLANPDSGDLARALAGGAAIVGLGGQGHVEAALALTPDALDSARRLGDFSNQLLVSVLDVWVRKHSGDLDGAGAVIQAMREAADSQGDPNPVFLALSEADVILARGEVRRSVSLLRDAGSALTAAGFAGFAPMAHYRLGQALAMLGDLHGAQEQLAAGFALEERTLELLRVEAMIARAWIHTALRDRTAATKVLSDAARIAEVQGQPLVEVAAHHAGLRMGDRGAAQRLLRLAPQVEGSFSICALRHARAAVSDDVTGLVEAASGFEESGLRVEAADILARAARVALRRGEDVTGHQLASRSVDIASAVGGFETPNMAAVAPGSRLTPRQRNVARLAATGLSNRDIASRLGVGVRTVESHLDEAYRRLGVTNRASLTEIFGSGGLQQQTP